MIIFWTMRGRWKFSKGYIPIQNWVAKSNGQHICDVWQPRILLLSIIGDRKPFIGNHRRNYIIRNYANICSLRIYNRLINISMSCLYLLIHMNFNGITYNDEIWWPIRQQSTESIVPVTSGSYFYRQTWTEL